MFPRLIWRSRERQRYLFDGYDQNVLENECGRISFRNIGQTGRSTYFLAVTADERATGHALIEVKPDGSYIRHWGTVADHLKTLKNA